LNDATATTTSRTAVSLGYLAVLPFAVGAALVWAVGVELRPVTSRALLAYCGIVISFIGGIHWGLVFARSSSAAGPLVWGVVPAIAAWLALLAHPGIGLLADAALLVACYRIDRRIYPEQGVAIWLPLRLRLTVFATLCCLAGAAGS